MNDAPTSGWSLPPAEARHVEEVCTRFEAAWKAGTQPVLEDYFGDTPEPARSILLQELLVLELTYRVRAGERPTLKEYRLRFPALADRLPILFRKVPGLGTGSCASEVCHTRSWGIMHTTHTTPPGTPSCVPGLPDVSLFPSRYEVLGEIGRGGMGVVYRARHKALDTQVAIKVSLPGAPNDRFLREAKLLTKIKSPHVVGLHDFEVLPNGSPMLVMEWVDGTDLGKLMRARGGSLPESQCLSWMEQTAQGMLAAAEAGVIHRDLKPSNILIDEEGRAQVADFGLARGPSTLFTELSHMGQLMGTPFYMAPEQAEDPRSVDTRADIYSFGATFYHALTGAPPFEGPTAFSVLYKHKTEPLISPRFRNPQISDRLNELLERCLAKSPQERFPSFAEVLEQVRPAPNPHLPWDAYEEAGLSEYLERYRARRDAYLQGGLAPNEGDRYELPRDCVVWILHGDITRQEVDAIVSSDTYLLTMHFGVSMAIRWAAGEAVYEEAERYAPVRPGRAVVTSAGRLKARFIFHGVTIGWEESEYSGKLVRPSRDLISEILGSCFYHAESLGVRSIAFPLLGTGGAGFSREVCLDTMFRFIARTLLRGLTPVREARIVLF